MGLLWPLRQFDPRFASRFPLKNRTNHGFVGDVNWVDKTNATSKKLVSVNSAGNALLNVSMDVVLYNNKRDSVSFWRLSETIVEPRSSW